MTKVNYQVHHSNFSSFHCLISHICDSGICHKRNVQYTNNFYVMMGFHMEDGLQIYIIN